MWQYALGFTLDKGKTWKANGDKVEDPILIEFLNKMGANGWELVSVTQHPLGDSRYVFKRPKP